MENRIERATIINVSIFFEAVLLLIATFWSRFASIDLGKRLSLDFNHVLIGALAGLILSFSVLFLFHVGKSWKVFAGLNEIIYKYLQPVVIDLKFIDILGLAIISGFCEEIFFRGVAQTQFGLLLTSLLFGFCHDPTMKHISYCLFTFCGALFLGWLYIATGNLWVPIVAHTVHNFISFLALRYFIKPPANEQEAQSK